MSTQDKKPLNLDGAKNILSQEEKPALNLAGAQEILKKKDLSVSPLTSPGEITNQGSTPPVSAGGTSGLVSGSSVSPNEPQFTVKPGTDFDPFKTAPKEVTQETSLGTKLYLPKKPSAVSTGLGATSSSADQNITGINEQVKAKHIADKKVIDEYEKYKVDRSSQQQLEGKTPFALDDSKNTIDFYLDYLKKNDPEEYNYVISRQKSLSEDKQGHVDSGDLEDIQEDDLMIQKTHADLLKKALALKSRVMGSKLEMATNTIKNNYSDVLKSVDEETRKTDDLKNKISEIDKYIQDNYQFQDGQIVTTPYNQKEAKDLLSQREDLISQYNSAGDKLKEITNNEDFKSAVNILDETQKNYDSLEAVYSKVRSNNPDAFKGLPEYKKQLEEEQEAQKKKDLQEKYTGGDFGVLEAAGRGLTKIPKSVSYIFKGTDDKYSVNDWLYDVVSSNVEDFDNENNPLPTGYNDEVYKDGKWNLKYLPGKVAGTITDMAPAIAITLATEGATAGMLARLGTSGELGTYLGSFAGEYVTQVSDYYDEASKAGMSNKDAMNFARNVATSQALIGTISPDVKLSRIAKEGLESYVETIAKGTSKTDALKNTLKKISENAMKEVPQENLQTWQEIQDKNNMYEKMGLNDKIVKDIAPAMIETTLISSILSLGMGSMSHRSPSRLQSEALYMAASQPDVVLERAVNMFKNGDLTKEQFDNFSTTIAKASNALSKTDSKMDAEKKAEILPALIEKEDLKEQKNNTDETQHESIKQKIAIKDEEIKNIIESPSAEQKEHDDFIKGFEEELAADEKTTVEIPKSENEMQLDGLIEKDDSQKSEPIELSVSPEEKTDNTDFQISELEKEKQRIKVEEYFQETITTKQYNDKIDSIDKEINNLKKKKSQVEEESVDSEVKQEKPTEDGKETQKTSEAEVLKTEEDVTEEQPAEKQVATSKQELIDEEDQVEEGIKDDQEVLKKMQDDLNILKQYSPSNEKLKSKTSDEIKTLATNKYQGMIERAYKAKLDGKINRNTYTIFRNAAGDILGPKIAEKNREVKGQIDAIKDKIKEKLLGEGYKTKQLGALSTGVPLTPKTIENFIDLTAEMVKKGVDAGYEVRRVIDKALEYVKKHPNYKSALEEAGVTDAQFRKQFENKIGDIEHVVKMEPVEEKKGEEKTETTPETTDKPETEKGPVTEESSTEEKTPVEPEKEIKPVSEESLKSGEEKERKGSKRLSEHSKKYKDIVSNISEEGKFYEALSKDKAAESVKSKVSEFEKAGLLDELAKDMLNGQSPFPEVVSHYAKMHVADRLNSIADKLEGNAKDFVLKTASNLMESAFKEGTSTAQKLSLMSLSAETMPISETGMKMYVKARLKTAQESFMTESQKESIKNITSEISSLETQDIESKVQERAKEMLKKMAEEIKGKEWVSKTISVISSLKEVLPDNC